MLFEELCHKYGMFCNSGEAQIMLLAGAILALVVFVGVPIMIFASKMNAKDRNRERVRKEKADLMNGKGGV